MHKIGGLLIITAILVTVINSVPAATAATTTVYEPGEEIGFRLLQGAVGGVSWSPDGSYVAVSLTSYSRVAVIPVDDLESGKSISVPFNPGPVEWRPDSEYIAVGSSSRLIITDLDGNRILDKDVGARVNDLAWTSDGRKLVAVLDNGDLIVWDAETGLTPPYPTQSAALTAVDWLPGQKYVILGDSSGKVRVLDIYSLDYAFQATILPTPIRSIEVSPDGEIVAIAGDNMTILAAVNDTSGNLTMYAVIDWGTRGSLAWSPDGSTLVIPSGMRLAVVNRTGTVETVFTPTREYPYTYAAWNPRDYSELALVGYNTVFAYTGLYIVYSGALVHVESSHPVTQVCAEGLCGSKIDFNPSGLNASFTVNVLAYTITGDSATVEAIVYFAVRPFAVYNVDAASALLGGKYSVYVPTGLSLLFLFTSPEAIVTLASDEVNTTVQGPVIAATPGDYMITIKLPEPENYLGPEWVLEKKLNVHLRPNRAVWLDYSSFSLSSVTARLVLDVESGSTVGILMPNDTVEVTVPGEHTEYIIPVGDYEIRIRLPIDSSVLVPEESVLERTMPVRVYPGDTVAVTFKYMDVLGELEIIAPEGSDVELKTPWPSHLINVELINGYVAYKAYPGNYTVTLHIIKPDNFLGPDPPVVVKEVTVEKGSEAIVNFYNERVVSDYLNLLASSAIVSVHGVEGYNILIIDDNVTIFSSEGPGPYRLLLPPGNYSILLVRPGDNAILYEEKIEVTGPGNYTIELSPPNQQTLPPAPVQPTTEEKGGISKVKIVVAVAAPIVVALVVVVIIRRRARPAF